MKRAWLLALMVSVATPAVAQQYQYVARTEAPALRQGAVTAGSLTWQCQGNVCTIGGPWPAPGVAACAALAREVGRITAYGRQGAMLNAQQLATCNANVVAVAPPVLRLPPQVVTGGPTITAPLRTPPPGPVAFTTPELSFVVGTEAAPRAPSVTVNFTAPELSFVVGAGATAPTATSISVSLTTPELSFVVR